MIFSLSHIKYLWHFNISITPPILATSEHDPTPAFLRYVGMSSDVHIHSIAKVDEAQKLLTILSTTIGNSFGNTFLQGNCQFKNVELLSG